MAAIVPYRAITKTAAGGSLAKRQDNTVNVKKTVINIEKVLQKKRKDTKKLNEKEIRTTRLIGEQKTRTAAESALEKTSKFNMNLMSKVPNFAVDAFSRIMNFLGIYLIGWITDKLPKIINAIKDLNQRIQKLGEIVQNMSTRSLNIMTSMANLIAAKTKQIATLDFGDKSGDVKRATEQLDQAYDAMEKDWDDANKLLTAPLGSFPVAGGSDDRRPGGKVQSGDLFEIIAGGEGGYESINRGNAGDSPGGAKKYFGRNLSEMTVNEVMRLQSAGQLFAVGKYQIIPQTMVGFVRNMGIKGTDKFDAATQEKFTDYVTRFKRPEVGRYIRGESNNRAEAAQELAREFASVGLSYAEAGKRRGQSRYAGSAGNRASISPDTIEAALDRARAARGGQGGGNGGSIIRPHKLAPTIMGGGRVLTSGMGMRGLALSPGMHMGVDVSGRTGEPLQAFTDGIVEATGYQSTGYGNYINWVDDKGVGHFYAHMNKPAFVRKGTRVKKGTILGELGSTGRSSGPHLHWETATNPSDTGRSKAAVLSRFNPLSKYGIDAPFGGTIRPDPSLATAAPTSSGHDLSPLPDAEPPLDMEKLKRLIKMAMEKRAATAPPKYNADKVPSTNVPVSSLNNLNSMMFTSLGFQ